MFRKKVEASSVNGDNKKFVFTKEFREVLRVEHAAINERRWPDRDKIEVQEDRTGPDGRWQPSTYNTTGIALSGGGIRSAAFCLGALQSLAVHELIGQIDYLSTVSGGGYIGASLSACMSELRDDGEKQEFPFAVPKEYRDRPSVGHLRDFSNYMLPRGTKSVIDIISVVLRGLATNLVFVLGVTFAFAWMTIVSYPNRESLSTGSFLPQILDAGFKAVGVPAQAIVNYVSGEGPFALTLRLLVLLAVVLVYWARSRSKDNARGCDVRGAGITRVRLIVYALLFMGALDVQPLAILGFFRLSDLWNDPKALSAAVKDISALFVTFSAALTPIVAFFSSRLGTFLNTSRKKRGTGVFLGRLFAHAAIWLAALVLPLLLWLFYIWLSAAGISDKGGYPLALEFMRDGHLLVPYLGLSLSVAWLYFLAAFFLSAIASKFAPNANSLHQLYRDKLSKAFLFDPAGPKGSGTDRDDLRPLDTKKLLDISPPSGGPYHLISAALNLQNSKEANRRGRNAGFFLFSSEYVGSDVTGYVSTKRLQDADQHVDLATAMAISGAAVSSNMGSQSVAVLAPTLTLLNFRLGYWMVNPQFIDIPKPVFRGIVKDLWTYFKESWPKRQSRGFVASMLTPVKGFWSWLRGNEKDGIPRKLGLNAQHQLKIILRILSKVLKLYVISEMFGRLDETKPHIYLTDGGHIENLGLYQLLKRGCREIIVIDGEADPEMAFNALAIVQRYARIDLGVRIDLPWQEIAKTSNAVTAAAEAGQSIAPEKGPHSALGVIHYPDGEDGLLLYVKSSLTGDESDYVMNYKQRNSMFPHESTGDQFFSEEQFEVYRALGFHAVENFFSDDQTFAWSPERLKARKFPHKVTGPLGARLKETIDKMKPPAPKRQFNL